MTVFAQSSICAALVAILVAAAVPASGQSEAVVVAPSWTGDDTFAVQSPFVDSEFEWDGKKQTMLNALRGQWGSEGIETETINGMLREISPLLEECSTCITTAEIPMPSPEVFANAWLAAGLVVEDETSKQLALESVARTLVSRIYASGPSVGHQYIMEAPWRPNPVFGEPGIAMRVIMPSESVRADPGHWDQFELTLSFKPVEGTLPATAFATTAKLHLVVSDYLTTKRALFLSEMPSFGLDFRSETAETARAREALIIDLFRRNATKEIGTALELAVGKLATPLFQKGDFVQ